MPPQTSPAGAGRDDDRGLAQWLRGRPDDDLARLMRLRPDLTIAPPQSTAVLTSRARQRMSVHRVAEDLDTMAMAVLAVLVLADADDQAVSVAHVRDSLQGRAPADAVDAALDRLRALAIAWGDDELHIVAAAREILPWPASFVVDPPDAGVDPDELRARIGALTPDERGLVDALVSGGGLGRTRDAADDAPPERPVQRLLHAGLLVKVDDQTVRLPDAVRAAVTGVPMQGEMLLTEPAVRADRRDPHDVDSASGGEAIELLRHAGAVIESLGAHPVPQLRSGGVGVREIRRLSKELQLDEHRIAFLLELLARAGLIRPGQPVPPPGHDTADEYWAPSDEIDLWLSRQPAQRWAVLAQAWMGMQRRIWEIGNRDSADKVVPALTNDLGSGTIAADRAAVLERLAAEDPGVAIAADDLVALMRWRRPRRHMRLPVGIVEYVLGEAQDMGVVARGALSAPGRALLGGSAGSVIFGGEGGSAGSVSSGDSGESGGDAAAAMAAAMPEPVDHVLLQADLTMIAPGPLVPELAAKIEQVADVESAGAATVYRVTEQSLRGGLDSGLSRTELHELFTGASKTPVPQALSYLIDDVARRHGQLRIGYATSFLRCEDPALLAEVLTRLPDLGLRRIAPTVAISELELADLLDALRGAGLPAVGEDSEGGVVDLRPRGSRVAPPRRVRQTVHRPVPEPLDGEQLTAVVAGMRAGDRADDSTGSGTVRADGSRASGAATVSLLQTATQVGRAIAIGYVDAQGTAIRRVVEPVGFSGGMLEAVDPVTGVRHTFSLHRITSVSLVD